jgi:hypothetical protein
VFACVCVCFVCVLVSCLPAMARGRGVLPVCLPLPCAHTPRSPSSECLAAASPSSGQFMVNEFGDGSLTFYGPFVTDFCVAAC